MCYLVREISSSSAEQRSGAEQINVALAQLNQVTQQNASSSEELASASNNFNSQAGKLKETVSFFKLDKSGEVSHQRDRIISQIEQLKAILNESEGNGSTKEEESSNAWIAPKSVKSTSKFISLSDELGGPSIQLDDFDSVSEALIEKGHESVNGESVNGTSVK